MDAQQHQNTQVVFGRNGKPHTLYACPFCGTAHDLTLDDQDDLECGWSEEPLAAAWVTCLYCSANGPGAETAEEAVDAWNRRLAAYTPHWN